MVDTVAIQQAIIVDGVTLCRRKYRRSTFLEERQTWRDLAPWTL